MTVRTALLALILGLCAGCGASTAEPASPAVTQTPGATVNAMPAAPSRTAQCKTVMPIVARLSTTLRKASSTGILPGEAVTELKQEQIDFDSAAKAMTASDLSSAAHAVADALGKERVSSATTGNPSVESRAAFKSAAAAFVMGLITDDGVEAAGASVAG